MKTTFVALTCAFALTHASPARSETAEPPDSWTHLKPGEEREGFAFTGEGTVHYKAALLGDCLRKDPKSGEIIVSAPSPKKHLRMVVCWDLDSGGLDAWVVNTGKSAIAARSIIPRRWRVIRWVGWSPTEHYALLFAAGEVTDGDMLSADLDSGRSHEIHFQKGTANKNEIQVIDPDTVEWVSPTAFRARMDVTCNPFEMGGDKCDPKKVLRSTVVKKALSTTKQ